jgi:hypothetical protein
MFGESRQPIGPWEYDNIAANLSAQQVMLAASANTIGRWYVWRAGSVTAWQVVLNAAAAGATLTIQIFKNGVAWITTTITVGNTFSRVSMDKVSYTFQDGDYLDLRISTPSGWTATTVDLVSFVEVEC